ncbi:MAG: hypothetical protein QW135_06690 [Ignisphaera sp.]
MLPRYRRGISAIIGAAVLLTIMIMFTAFYITILQKFVEVANYTINSISSAEESKKVLETLNALWDYNGTHVTIFIENRASRAVLVTAIAMVFSDSSYTTISRANKTLASAVVQILYIGNENDTARILDLVLPLALPPATETMITIKMQKEPITVSIAVEASPIKTVIVSRRVNEEQKIHIIELPRQTYGEWIGTTTWLGNVSIPVERKGITNNTYPRIIVSNATQRPQVLINLVSRGAITYTDFETYPLTGWDSRGGIWSSVENVVGAKGRVLQGNDNNQGIGAASQYYYTTSLSGYTRLWIVAKTRWVSGTGWYGVAMINNARNRLYTIEINTAGRIEILSFNVESRNGWYTLASATIPGYSTTSWYIIVVDYTVTTTAVNIMARLYNSQGTLITTVSASSTSRRRFTPTYIGVDVDNVVAYFDDFLITTRDPRYIVFQNVMVNYRIEIWDDLNNLVRSVVATSSTVNVDVVTDVVVGRGSNGKIYVYDSRGNQIASYIAFDAIIGGDTYQLQYIYGNYTAKFSDEIIVNNLVKPLNARLYFCIYTNTTVNISIVFNNRELIHSSSGDCNNSVLPIDFVGRSNNVVVYASSREPFNLTIEYLDLYIYGFYTDILFEALVIAIGGSSRVAFCRIDDILIKKSINVCYLFDIIGSTFNGETAITYDSDSHVLYIVNRSGIYLWNFISTEKVTESCKATGIGVRIELVEDGFIVLPGSGNNTICVYNPTDAYLQPLPNDFELYMYTSSAVYRNSVYFTCIDKNGAVWLLRYDVDTWRLDKLKPIAINTIIGLAIDSSSNRVYIPIGGFWRDALNNHQSYMSIYIYSVASNRIVHTAIPIDTTTYVSASCCDRAEIYGNYMLIVERGSLLAIDISRIDYRKNVAIS